MRIQCVLLREGGSRVDLGGLEYHFEPLPDGAHVAKVEREDHIDRFLSIPEGYKLYHGKHEPKGEPLEIGEIKPPAPKAPDRREGTRLEGSSQHAPYYDIGGQQVALIDVVRKAFEASGLSEDDWNELDEDDRAARIDIALDAMAEAADGQADNQGNETAPVEEAAAREALVEAYKAKFGKAPHHKKSLESIKAELEA